MTEETRDLINAVLEAIDLPPASTVGNDKTRTTVLAARCMETAVVLRSVLERDGRIPGDVRDSLTYLRTRLASHPTDTYEHWGQL